MITFLRPDGTIYRAVAPMASTDVAIPDRPQDLSSYASFDVENWQWVENSMAKIQRIQAEYAPDLYILRQAESAARLAGNETEEQALITEYRAKLKERDEKIQAIIMQPKEQENDTTPL